ncbi:MAG: toll/interleukin-1 receptor domain-containing protein [Myxococcales bacterium]|nr:toll/interleukin-1 receptor domain-containing protein [Myxococcales bacterium]
MTRFSMEGRGLDRLLADGPSVFVSYASVDGIPFSGEVVNHLRAHRFEAFLDRWNVQPGMRVGAVIRREIARAQALLVCLTPGSISSGWVEAEVNHALRTGCKVILLLDGPYRESAWLPGHTCVQVSRPLVGCPAMARVRVWLLHSWRARQWRKRAS